MHHVKQPLKMLSVLQINLHKSRMALVEFLKAMKQEHADVTLVQEQWIAAGNMVTGLNSSRHNAFCRTYTNRF